MQQAGLDSRFDPAEGRPNQIWFHQTAGLNAKLATVADQFEIVAAAFEQLHLFLTELSGLRHGKNPNCGWFRIALNDPNFCCQTPLLIKARDFGFSGEAGHVRPRRS